MTANYIFNGSRNKENASPLHIATRNERPWTREKKLVFLQEQCVRQPPILMPKHTTCRRKKGGKSPVKGIDIIKEHARKVMNELGKGHSESVYHRAMITSLNKGKVAHRAEVVSPILFMGEVVGFGRCDLVVKDIVVEIKANSMRAKSAIAQIKKYTTHLAKAEKTKYYGIVVNFNQSSGEVETCLAR